MNEIIILILLLIIGGQIFERKILLDRESKDKNALLEEITKLQTALISKTANDYVSARAMDNVIEKEPKKPNDEVESVELSNEEFDKMIKQQNT